MANCKALTGSAVKVLKRVDLHKHVVKGPMRRAEPSL